MVDPFYDPTSIGNLAINLGYATREQVTMALKRQEQRTPLGKLLVEANVLSEEQLEELLHIQKVERAKTRREKTKLQMLRQQKKLKEVQDLFKETAGELEVFLANGKT